MPMLRQQEEREPCLAMADFIAPADYRDNSKLARRVQLLLDSVISGIAYAAEVAACKAENAPPA